MENLDNLILEEMPEPEPTEFDKTMANIDAIQNEWNKPQEEVEIKPYVPTQEELDMTKKEQRKAEIKTRLNQLSEDIVQHQAGEIVPDYPSRLEEFRNLHNELRQLEGKEPRQKQIQI